MTTLTMLGLLIFGIMSYRALPVSDLPNVDFPTLQVSATLPGASADTMAAAVATPLERQFSTIAGLESMTDEPARLPIALGYGAGADVRRPLGLGVIGGPPFSQVLTLYVTPVIYLYMEGLGERVGARTGAWRARLPGRGRRGRPAPSPARASGSPPTRELSSIGAVAATAARSRGDNRQTSAV